MGISERQGIKLVGISGQLAVGSESVERPRRRLVGVSASQACAGDGSGGEYSVGSHSFQGQRWKLLEASTWSWHGRVFGLKVHCFEGWQSVAVGKWFMC